MSVTICTLNTVPYLPKYKRTLHIGRLPFTILNFPDNNICTEEFNILRDQKAAWHFVDIWITSYYWARCTGHLACTCMGQTRNACKVLIRKTKVSWSAHRLEDNIILDLNEIEWQTVDWIQLTQHKVYWWEVVCDANFGVFMALWLRPLFVWSLTCHWEIGSWHFEGIHTVPSFLSVPAPVSVEMKTHVPTKRWEAIT
jgi:hypothetical protein